MALVAVFPDGVKHAGEAAAINNEPAGEEVDKIAAESVEEFDVCGDLEKFRIDPGEVIPAVEELDTIAFEPKRAQAFFHLHCVHQRSRCSNP